MSPTLYRAELHPRTRFETGAERGSRAPGAITQPGALREEERL